MPRNHRNPYIPSERAKEMEEKETQAETESKRKYTQQEKDSDTRRPSDAGAVDESRDRNQPKVRPPEK